MGPGASTTPSCLRSPLEIIGGGAVAVMVPHVINGGMDGLHSLCKSELSDAHTPKILSLCQSVAKIQCFIFEIIRVVSPFLSCKSFSTFLILGLRSSSCG